MSHAGGSSGGQCTRREFDAYLAGFCKNFARNDRSTMGISGFGTVVAGGGGDQSGGPPSAMAIAAVNPNQAPATQQQQQDALNNHRNSASGRLYFANTNNGDNGDDPLATVSDKLQSTLNQQQQQSHAFEANQNRKPMLRNIHTRTMEPADLMLSAAGQRINRRHHRYPRSHQQQHHDDHHVVNKRHLETELAAIANGDCCEAHCSISPNVLFDMCSMIET